MAILPCIQLIFNFKCLILVDKMGFQQILAQKTGLPPEVLPNSYQILGHVLLLKLLDKKALKHKKAIGNTILKISPNIHTVCLQKGVAGEFREPKIEVIAGIKQTETVHQELNCIFSLDVAKIMWSKGNHFEKKRMISVVKPNEIIVDMFAGVGYWSIPIAKHTKAGKIYAIEKNKTAFDYLKQNIRANYITNIIPILGDCRKVVNRLEKADRIIMGYFPNTLKFLPVALKISKKGTIIHLHELASDLKKLTKEIWKYKVKIMRVREVKEYSPSKRHYVFDLSVL
ncbi:MAG: class I SAM-dependent methyltransferase family protein [Candidatus Nanoarchaeia archaeon]